MSKILYLGIERPSEGKYSNAYHYPIIRIIPRSKEDSGIREAFEQFHYYTHLIFTSKSSVGIFCKYASELGIGIAEIQRKSLIAIGEKTAARMTAFDIRASHISSEETAEGLVKLFETLSLESNAYFFWPHSALSRPVLLEWFQASGVKHRACIFYDTLPWLSGALPVISQFEEIIFTSPSVVEAYLRFFGELPKDKTLTAIGPVTKNYLQSRLRGIAC